MFKPIGDFDYRLLRPCPFCGDTPLVSSYDDGVLYRIECHQDDCSVECRITTESMERAVAVWNHRA